MTDVRTVAVWLSDEQLAFGASVLREAGVDVRRIGMPSGGRDAGKHFGADVDVVSDLRQLLTSSDEDGIILLTAQDGAENAVIEDVDLLEQVVRRGVRLLTMEPLVTDMRGVRRLMSAAGGREGLRFVPRFDLSPGVVTSAEARAGFGAARSLHYASRCRPVQGSLGARLFDAMSVVLSCLGEPEHVDASVVSIRSQSGLHLAPPESLLALTGDLHAHLRYAGGRAASLSLSDRAGDWFRGLTLLGESGCLRVHEEGFQLMGADGEALDDSDSGPIFSDGDAGLATTAIAAAISGGLDPLAPAVPPLAWDVILSMSQAALLSARTGQPECPATIRRMG